MSSGKFDLLLFIIIVVKIFSSSFAQPSKQNELKNENLILNQAAEQYVLLHLVHDLSNPIEMAKSSEGRRWLRNWNIQLNTIMFNIVTYHGKRGLQWYSNWFERLKSFHVLQANYLKTIIDQYYVYDEKNKKSIWPRITYDLDFHVARIDQAVTKEEFLKQSDDYKANAKATEAEVDNVLRFHRPLTQDEMAAIKRSEKERRKAEGIISYEDDSNIFTFAKFLKSKKYYIIDKKKILNMQKISYELMRKNLIGKSTAELDYQMAIFRVQRITAEIDLWKKYSVYDLNDDKFDQRVPRHMHLLSDDDNPYRKYMNFDDSYFTGNLLYGPNDRYDDPIHYGHDFEYNSEIVIGNRYKPMSSFADELRQFYLLSDRFTQCKLEDLLLMNIYLERFKTWTFWYEASAKIDNQWFIVDKSKKDLYAMKPNNHYHKDHNTMVEDVINTMKKTKTNYIKDFNARAVDSVMKNFMTHQQKEINSLFQLNHINFRKSNLVGTKNLYFFYSLNFANLFQSSITPRHSSNDLSPTVKRPKLIMEKNDESKTKKNNYVAIEQNELNNDKALSLIEAQFEDFLNPNSNTLLKQIINDKNIDQISINADSNVIIQNKHSFSDGGDRTDIDLTHLPSNIDVHRHKVFKHM